MKEEVVVGGGLKTYKLFEEVIEVLFEAFIGEGTLNSDLMRN